MPSWTPQKTWTSETLTSSDLNVYVRDDMEYLKAIADSLAFSGCQVDRNGTVQSINDSSETAITFTRENVDVGGWISVPSDTITVPASAIPSGYTRVAAPVFVRLEFAANATGVRKAFVYQNGNLVGANSVSASSADTTDLIVAKNIVISSGDTLQLKAYQTSGGALNVVGSVSFDIYTAKPID